MGIARGKFNGKPPRLSICFQPTAHKLLCSSRAHTASSLFPATATDCSLNAKMYNVLDFSNQQDFEDATRGFIVGLEPPRIIPNDTRELKDLGFYAWNMEAYEFLNEEPTAPPSVNPSLWPQQHLNII